MISLSCQKYWVIYTAWWNDWEMISIIKREKISLHHVGLRKNRLAAVHTLFHGWTEAFPAVCLLTEGVNCPSHGFHSYLWGRQRSSQTTPTTLAVRNIILTRQSILFYFFCKICFYASKHCKREYVVNKCSSSLSPRCFSNSQIQPWLSSLHVCKCIFHGPIFAAKLRPYLTNVNLTCTTTASFCRMNFVFK